MTNQHFSPDSFQTFGELLKYLRRREHLTQLELSIAVGYSDAQITRLEKDQRRPDITALKALFIPALHLENEPELIARFLELAQSSRQEEAPAQGIAPYKGLLFFDETDAELFFGREVLTAHLAERVTGLAVNSSSRFLTVVGASGIGKSSLVRAGLAVALKQAGWDVRIFTPGAFPRKVLDLQLESHLEEAGAERLLILVDQFEETFTLCHDESERGPFIEKLLHLARESSGKVTIVIALRADFYSHCAQYPLLRQAVAADQEYMGQMNSEELRRAIQEPAKHGGWEFEPGLVNMLLNDIGAQGAGEPEPGALPLLSHALLATWERRRGHTLTLDGYHASGGVRGAIAETAESVFTDQLNQSQQELARDVFLRLTELGEGTEDTRRRAALNELVRQSTEATQLRSVLNTLAEARLITLNEDSAEVAHEALIREWQRLHEWLTEDRDGLILHRHLTESAQEWESRGHDPAELYRGARLAQAREWASANGERLNVQEQTFLAASIEQEQRDALEREAQRQRELEAAQKLAETEQSRAEEQAFSIKRLRQRGVFLSSALVLAMVAAVFAGIFADRNSTLATSNAEIAGTAQADEVIALQERQTAQQQALIASVRELSTSANFNLDIDPERSILLALQAVNKTYTIDHTILPEAEDALRRAVQDSRLELTLPGDVEVLWGAVFSPDGNKIATAGVDGTAKIWDAITGEKLLVLKGTISGSSVESGFVWSIAFSPDSRFLATAGGDQIVRIWNATTGEERSAFYAHDNHIFHLTFSPDGSRLATSSWDGTTKVWDAHTGEQLVALSEADDGRPEYVAFSPDGTRLAVAVLAGVADGWATIWEVDTGDRLMTLRGHNAYMRTAAFSPDGRQIVTTGDDRTTRIWDAEDGSPLMILYGHSDAIIGAAFSPDGQRLATAGWDGVTKVWDVATGQELFALAGHSDSLWSVAFSPDGNHILTASGDGTARVWNASLGRDYQTLVNGPPITGQTGAKVAYSPDGTHLAVAYSDTTAKVWDLTSGKLLFSLTGHTDAVTFIAYSVDGTRIATASQDMTAKIWDASSGRELMTLSGHSDFVVGAAFSPDGTRLATASSDMTAKVWDLATREIIHTLTGHKGFLLSLAFSPDGSRVATSSFDGFAIIWNAATGQELFRLITDIEPTIRLVSFSPDGSRLTTSSYDGTVNVWDAVSGKELQAISGHVDRVFDIAFSTDGKSIATAGADRTMKLWDAQTGEILLTLHDLPDGVSGIAFSPNGLHLAAGVRDGTARIYLLRIEDLIELAKQRVTRSLTAEECQQYLHTATCPAQP